MSALKGRKQENRKTIRWGKQGIENGEIGKGKKIKDEGPQKVIIFNK